MGLFSRRKSSSIQSYGAQSMQPSSISQLQHAAQSQGSHLSPLSTDAQQHSTSTTDYARQFPLNDRTCQTNNSIYTAANTTSQQYSRSFHPTSIPSARQASSEYPLPTLTPRLNKKGERPVSAASRVFFNNGKPITPHGKPPKTPKTSSSGARNTTSAPPILPKDISATNFRSTLSLRSLKVKSLDLLKSNPSLKYLAPETAPWVSDSRGGLRLTHDGRGLFASKTVANIADELDTRGLRKLLERDSRRYGSRFGSKSDEDLRSRYRESEGMPGEIPLTPRSRGNTMGSTIQGYGDEGERAQRDRRYEGYNPFMDPGPSTIRPVLGSDRSESFNSTIQEPPYPPPQPPSHPHPQLQRKHNLPPILLFGQTPHQQEQRRQSPSKESHSPILLMGPHSARSTETQSTLPRPRTETPILLHSQQTRPPILSMATDITDTVSSHGEYETADDHFGTETEGYNTEDYGSDTPNALSDDDLVAELEEEGQEWHESPVIPGVGMETPKARQWTWNTARDYDVEIEGGDGEMMGRGVFEDVEVTPKAMRPQIQIPYASPTIRRNPSFTETESSRSPLSPLDNPYDDSEDDINTPIFASTAGTVIPSSTPIVPINTVSQDVTSNLDSNPKDNRHSDPITLSNAANTHAATTNPDIHIIPPGSSGTIDSESSWLSGNLPLDIQSAVRKSFHGSPGKTPIILEASGTSPLRIDTKGSGWKPDYQGQGYGDEDGGDGVEGLGQFGDEERVRQGSKARRVEVIDSPSLEGFEARLSGESPERTGNGEKNRRDGVDGGIILL